MIQYWRNLPNMISVLRLASTPVLLMAVLTYHRRLFTWLLLACFVSDILDGLIARVFRLRSRIGAFLDSTADMIVLFISLAGVLVFRPDFLRHHAGAVTAITAFYLIEAAVALVRYGKISSFHTLATRLAAYAEGIFLMSLFLWGYRAGIFYTMLVLAFLALWEEMLLLYILPQPRSDVRGLYWVLRDRDKGHA